MEFELGSSEYKGSTLTIRPLPTTAQIFCKFGLDMQGKHTHH